MDYTVSFANQHKVFLSEEKMDDLDVTGGDAVMLSFNGIDQNMVFKCESKSNFEVDKELYPLFFSLHYCLDRMGDFHYGLFSDITPSDIDGDNPISDSLKNYEGLREYISSINHINNHRFSDSDIIIGCGISDIIVSITENGEFSKISTPFSRVKLRTVSDALLGELPDLIDICPFDGEIHVPQSIHICTYHTSTTDEQKNRIKEHIVDEKYMMTGKNYEYSLSDTQAHGPLMKNDFDGDVLIATKDNIEFTNSRRYRFDFIEDIDIPSSAIRDAIEETFDNHDIVGDQLEYEIDESDELLKVMFEPKFFADFQKAGDSIEITLSHATNNEYQVFDRLIPEISIALDETLGTESELYYSEPSPKQVLLNREWVLDTNSVYRQKPNVDYNSISEFILTNPLVYGSRFIIPWQVLCEINRHKDSNNSQTRNASKQGIKNLTIIDMMDKIGFFDIEFEPIPESIDNSIQKNTGITDLSILDSVPEKGTLFTSDKYLMNISSLMGINVDQIESLSGFSEKDHRNSYWDFLEDYLSQNGPTKYEEVIDVLQDTPIEDDLVEKDPEQLIQEKIRDNEIMKSTDDDSILLSLCSNRDALPTFSMINSIIQEIEDVDGGKYISDHALEKLRRAFGGLSSTNRPNITFILPSEYVFRAEETDQISSLETLRWIDNCNVKTINLGLDSAANSDIENSIIRACTEENCTMICSPEEDTRKFRLLDIDFETVDI
ncbi:hypothetical protein [Natrialba sp. PRR66]|uniref:hypothetical protein n=1 Tax=Natrialba sp. PRR66 TaxID=3098146 RepID=UPI002B1DE0D5|nr:hypothetical protein [Natrialba sp. PRR66]